MQLLLLMGKFLMRTEVKQLVVAGFESCEWLNYSSTKGIHDRCIAVSGEEDSDIYTLR